MTNAGKGDMKMRFPKLFLVVVCLSLPIVTGTGLANGASELANQIEKSVAKVRSAKSVNARTEAAEKLANLTQKFHDKEITETAVADITSLLDSPDESVRYWVAMALGNLGPAAKSAAPKLEEMLPEAECLDGTITSASGIRYALTKMGIKLPPPPKCEPAAG